MRHSLRVFLPLVLVLLDVLLDAPAARPQTLVQGRGPAARECYGAWLAASPNRGATALDCEDGDPACDLDRTVNGACDLAVAACLHLDDRTRCTPRSVRRVAVRASPSRLGRMGRVPLPAPPRLPVAAATCGEDAVITLPLWRSPRGRLRPSKRVTLRLTTRVRGRADRDRLRLRCVPNRGAGQCGANPAGGPAELRLEARRGAADLDLGWTGAAHDVGVPADATLRACLAGCGATTGPRCGSRDDATAAVQRATLGAPVPLVAAGLPACIVTRLGAPALAGLSADLAAGSVSGTLALVAEVYGTSLTQVCPRCSGPMPGAVGTCRGGAREGRACVTAAVVSVPGAAGSAAHTVSADCLPAGRPLGSTALAVPLTTGVATLSGPRPCGAVADDACGGACDASCTGRACATVVDGQCIAATGGLGQRCCTTDPERPCFPTAAGAPIVRPGSASTPAPPFGDPAYPKQSALTLAGTFCLPSSGSSLVDTVLGLPGPGAIVLPMTATWGP